VEGAAYEEVEQARASGRSRVVRYGISDEQAWDVGLACGGTIDVLIEPSLDPVVNAAAHGLGQAVITPLPADSPGPTFGAHEPGEGSVPAPKLVVDETGALDGSSGDPALDQELRGAAVDVLERGRSRTVELGGRSWFVEAFPRQPRLVIVGAVQVAMALDAIARTLGYRTVVIDGRSTFATRERFPDADELLVGWPDELADAIGLGPRDAVVVLTHDVKFDEPAIVTALARGCRYVGAVGSRTTQADRRARLIEAGVRQEDLDRLRGPIGLDLGGREPAETALSIMAEVVAARFGGSGVPMKELAGRR
jgi:xanthine dehydrogenase accessory factor